MILVPARSTYLCLRNLAQVHAQAIPAPEIQRIVHQKSWKKERHLDRKMCGPLDILQWVLVVLIPHQISSSLRERRRPILRIFGSRYKDPDSIKVLLNPLVKECLAHLRGKTKEDTVFSGVYILMSRMTLPNPRQRPHTGEICNDLAALLKASDSRQSEPHPV